MFTGNAVCPCDIVDLVQHTDALNSKTVQKINDTQELVMINDFARETNERLFKKSLQDRISDISSWRWVLEDLSKRLDESVSALKYELKAIKVVVQRLKEEIYGLAKNASRPAASCPASDFVEAAVLEECNFLRDQKKVFRSLEEVIEKQISDLEKTKDRIGDDILNKEETLNLEEDCGGITMTNLSEISIKEMRKIRSTTLLHWENRCRALKDDGLRALSKSLITRQQARGARVQLTIVSQSLANKVDAALRKRIHINLAKLQELDWQRQEVIRDLQSLEEELKSTEKSLLTNMEQERVISARLADRSQRPPGELTKDDVDKKLKNELGRVRRFIKDLRCNLEEITSLQNHLKDTLVKMDCVAEDIIQVLRLDEERYETRLGPENSTKNSTNISPADSRTREMELNSIKEEDELVEEASEGGDDEGDEVDRVDYPV